MTSGQEQSDELERSTLAECEAIIERGLQTFYEVGIALLKIREEELYSPEYATFSEYCFKRWGWEQRCARQNLRAAEVIRNLASGAMAPLPDIERQVRPLTRLEPEQQQEAWRVAVEQSPRGRPTAREVENVVRTQFENRPTQAEEQAERREREAQERAEQLLREKREAEERAAQALRERRAAELRTEELLKERDEIQTRQYLRFRKLIEAMQCIAGFHQESVAETWEGITNARGGENIVEYLDNAQRCLTRLKVEHPNAVRKPGVVVSKPG